MDNINNLTLFIGDSCNLRCNYCYINHNELSKHRLNYGDCKRAIDIFMAMPDKNKTIEFSGGEPLIRYSLLKKLVEYGESQKEGAELNWILNTNGTLLDNKKLKFLIDKRIKIKLSIDGSRDTHDKNRKFMDGRGSYECILNNLRDVDKGNVSVNCVFNKKTYPQLIEGVKKLADEGFFHLGFVPEMNEVWDKKDISLLRGVMKNFLGHYVSLFAGGKGIFIMDKLKSMTDKNAKDARGLGCNKIILGTDKRFYMCYRTFSLNAGKRKELSFGNLKEGINYKRRGIFLKERRKSIANLTKRACSKCGLRPYCACPIDCLTYCENSRKDFGSYFRSHCSLNKVLLNTFLEIKKKLIKNKKFIRMYVPGRAE